MTDTEKNERRKREIEKFKANIAIPRPGSAVQPEALPVLVHHGIDLSDILYLPLAELQDNPLNEYPALPEEELAELESDIREKGILVPLIVKLDGVIVCGHNRKAAALRAGLKRAPVQQILSPLSAALEKDIMKSENDRRRGGRWSKEQKEAFIRENFEAELTERKHGGARKRSGRKNQGSLNLEKAPEGEDLARKIEKKSRGQIPAGTAKRIVAGLRKKAGSAPATGKDSRSREKLLARLRTIQQVIAVLEKKLADARAQKKIVQMELQKINGN